MFTKKFTQSLSVSLISLALLSACGSDSNNDSNYEEPAPTPAPTVTNFPAQTAAPASFTANEAGDILVSAEGLSLYFFANDEKGVSNCNAEDGAPAGGFTDAESCAGRWPPVLQADGAEAQAPFSFIERVDGTMQWAYKDYPLYLFNQDSAQGDILGDGVGGVWYLARPTPIRSANEEDGPYIKSQGNILTASVLTGEVELSRVEKEGFSLYTFDDDPLDVANCFNLGDGACIDNWPPLLADSAAKPSGLYDVVEQDNGVSQWTFRGKPLYLFKNDIEATDINGHGAGGSFFLASRAPAMQREINDKSWLTATGRVYILATNADGELESNATDKDQFSLYTFANDEAGVSNCSGGCLANWPAFLATMYDKPVGNYGIIERSDGFMQWTYKDKPLYFFVNDTAIDDTNGQNLNGFSLVAPPQTDIAYTDSPLGNTLTVNGEVSMLQVNSNNEFEVVKADKTGFQLYTVDIDNTSESNCSSTDCIGNWPALLAMPNDEAQAPFSIFERADGNMQWALNGKPLYFFTPDQVAGEQRGEGAGDVWWIARPAPVRLANFEGIGSGFVANRLDINGSERNSQDREDFSLYTFDVDVADSGVSSCTNACAQSWPPLYALEHSQAFGAYSVIERLDSQGNPSFQWAYKGKPLYFFASDSQVGQANGANINNWRLATAN